MSTSNWNAGRKAWFLNSASGAVLLAGMAVMTPEQAEAACGTVLGIFTCSGFGSDTYTGNGNALGVTAAPLFGTYTLNINNSGTPGIDGALTGLFLTPTANDFVLNVTQTSKISGGTVGVLALSGGAVTINTSGTISGGTTGIVAVSNNKDVKIYNAGTVKGGDFGILAASVSGNVVIGPRNDVYGAVESTNGIGILALAGFDSIGNAGTGGGNVTVDAGKVNASGSGMSIPGIGVLSGGVIGVALAGKAQVNLHGDVTVEDDGLFGGAAFTVLGGNAGVELDGDVTITGAQIGAAAATLAGGNATVVLGEGSKIEAGLVGAAAAALADGNASVTLDEGSTIEAGLVGVVGATLGAGSTLVTIGDGATVDSGGIAVLGISAAGSVTLENEGGEIVGGGGAIVPVVASYSATGTTVTNDGKIHGAGGASQIAVASAGGNLDLTNTGDVIGSVIAYTTGDDDDNKIDNQGTWTTSGLSVLATEGAAGDNIIENAAGATVDATGNKILLMIADTGDNELTNEGKFEVNVGAASDLAHTSVFAQTSASGDNTLVNKGRMSLGGITNFVQWTDEGNNIVTNEATGVIDATGLTTFSLGTGEGLNRLTNQGTINAENLVVTLANGAGDNEVSNSGRLTTTGSAVFTQVTESGDNDLVNRGRISIGGSVVATLLSGSGDNTIDNSLFSSFRAGDDAVFTMMTGEGDNVIANGLFSSFRVGDDAIFTMVTGRGDNVIVNELFSDFRTGDDAIFTMVTGEGDNVIANGLFSSFRAGDDAIFSMLTEKGDNVVDNSLFSSVRIGDDAVFSMITGEGDNTVSNSLFSDFRVGDDAVFSMITGEGDNTVSNSQFSDFRVGDDAVFTMATGSGDNSIVNDQGSRFRAGDDAVFTLATGSGNNSITNGRDDVFSVGDDAVFTLLSDGGNNRISNRGTFTVGDDAVFSLATKAGNNSITNGRNDTVTVGDDAVFTLLSGAGDNRISNRGTFTVGDDAVFTLLTAAGNNSITNGRNDTVDVGDDAVFTLFTGEGDNRVSNRGDFTIGDNAAISLGTLKGDNHLSNRGEFSVAGAAMFNLGSVSGSNFVRNSGGFTTDGPTLFNLATASDGDNVLSNSGTFDVSGATMFNFAALDGNNHLENTDSFSAFGFTLFNMAASGNNTVDNDGEFSVIGLTSFNFAGTNSTFNNKSGAVFEALGATTLWGLDTFNNDSLLTMQNGWSDYGLVTMPGTESGVGDWTLIDGDFVAGADSGLSIDARLSVKGDSSSDVLSITGAVVGPTQVYVNYDPAVPGGYNPDGISVVRVWSGETAVGDFKLANGPIDRGLFTYDLFLNLGSSSSGMGAMAVEAPDLGGATWVLASYADSSAYALASFAGIAQGVWNTTSDSWIDRAGDLRVSSQQGSTDPTKKSGIWGRLIGNGAERSTEKTITPFPNQSVTIDTGYDQTLWGFQGGIDHEFEGTVADGVLVAGVLGGYVSSSVNYNSGDSVRFSGPQVGVYASWVKGGAYVDALVKGDFLKADYNVAGSNSDTDSTTIGVRVETGYRYFTATGLFIEPNASLAYAHTSIDDINVAGTPVRFDDGDGLEGKLGARFGGTYLKDGVKYDPYLSVGIAGNLLSNNSVFFSSGPGLVIEDEAPDVFGEVGAGLNIFSSKSGWTGFAKADLRFGDDYIGGTGKIGANWAW